MKHHSLKDMSYKRERVICLMKNGNIYLFTKWHTLFGIMYAGKISCGPDDILKEVLIK